MYYINILISFFPLMFSLFIPFYFKIKWYSIFSSLLHSNSISALSQNNRYTVDNEKQLQMMHSLRQPHVEVNLPNYSTTQVIASVKLQLTLLQRCSDERDSEIPTTFEKRMFNTMKSLAMNAIIVCRTFLIVIKTYLLVACSSTCSSFVFSFFFRRR